MQKKKITKGEIDLVRKAAMSEFKPIEFITRGRVYIEFQEKGIQMKGDRNDVDMVKKFIVDGSQPKELTNFLSHFGWAYSDDGKGVLTGEGVVAWTLFNILNGNMDEHRQLISDFYKNLKLSC